MNRTTRRRLVLAKESLRTLGAVELADIHAGEGADNTNKRCTETCDFCDVGTVSGLKHTCPI